jgi:integrase
LRRRIEAGRPSATPHERPSVEDAGRHYLDHLAGVGRKRSTLMDYESHLRVHLASFFGAKPLHRIEPRDVEAFIAAKRREGRAPKSVLNYLGLLHSILEFGQRRGSTAANRCKLVDKPRVGRTDADIRFLDQDELEALLRAAPDDDVGRVDRLMWLTAAMTGLRHGELLALRWRDVDWLAGRLRVRRSFVRGEFGTPKSHRSSRSVPLADRVAAELDAHHRATAYGADDDLVFGHPHLGTPMERSRLLSATRRQRRPLASATCGSRTSATPSARGWPRPASRCGRCRSGWATATTRRRSSTPATRRSRTSASS